MTREHKLALILGFAAFLLVAVLLGEHFSKARQAQLDPVVVTPTQPAVAAAPVDGGQVPLPPDQHTEGLVKTSLPSPTEPTSIVMGSPPPAVETSDVQSPLAPRINDPAGAGSAPTTPAGDPVLPPPNNTKPELPFSTGVERRHPVEAGDNLYKIATRYYGDSSLWKRLGDYNKDKVSGNTGLRQGVTLRIPPKDVLMGKALLDPNARSAELAQPVKPASAKPEATRTAAKDERAKPAAGRSYTVRKGDTLGTIAQSQLGTTTRWRDILKLNSKVLDNEDDLQVGMVLAMPPR